MEVGDEQALRLLVLLYLLNFQLCMVDGAPGILGDAVGLEELDALISLKGDPACQLKKASKADIEAAPVLRRHAVGKHALET